MSQTLQAAHEKEKTSGVGVTDHAILRRSGFTVQSPRAAMEDPRQDHGG